MVENCTDEFLQFDLEYQQVCECIQCGRLVFNLYAADSGPHTMTLKLLILSVPLLFPLFCLFIFSLFKALFVLDLRFFRLFSTIFPLQR